MKNSKGLFIAFFLIIIVVSACNKTVEKKRLILDLPTTMFDYETAIEDGKSVPIKDKIKDGSKEFYNDNTATLGRVLFYDVNLSANGTVSCGSCHEQSLGFADGKKGSSGFSEISTPRNSMAIINVADNNNMFWDSRVSSPLDLSLKPVFDHIEMGILNNEMLVSKIKGKPYYKDLFQSAFNNGEINKENISIAITSFLNAIYSKQSKFDKEKAGNFTGFTTLEKYGMELFNSSRLKCGTCHSTSNFSAPDFEGGPYGKSSGGFNGDDGPKGTANIGLDLNYKDQGLKDGQFKIPSLRNIELTAPYMHDGRFSSLNDVLNHYSNGIKIHRNLDSKFIKNGQAVKLNLSDFEKDAVIAFLETLTDKELITNHKFSNPFVLGN